MKCEHHNAVSYAFGVIDRFYEMYASPEEHDYIRRALLLLKDMTQVVIDRHPHEKKLGDS